MDETPLARGGELKLRSMHPKLATVAEKVLTARVFAGDARMRREAGRLCKDGDVVCPFGCTDAFGAVAFTWQHATLCCRHVELCELRQDVASAAEQAAQDMTSCAKSGSVEHSQLEDIRRLFKDGLEWRCGQAEPRWQADELLPLRRWLGGLVNGKVDGTHKVGKRAAATRAAGAVRQAGLTVLMRASELAPRFNETARACATKRRKLQLHVGAWRQLVVSGGPERAAAVARVRVAALVTWECFRQVAFAQPLMPLEERLGIALAPWEARAEAMVASQPLRQWWLLMIMQRWRRHVVELPIRQFWAKKLLRRWFNWAGEAWREHADLLEAPRHCTISHNMLLTGRSVQPSFSPGPRRWSLCSFPELVDVSQSTAGAAAAAPMEHGGGGGSRWRSGALWWANEPRDAERRARRAWAVGGGCKAMATEEREARAKVNAKMMIMLGALSARQPSAAEAAAVGRWAVSVTPAGGAPAARLQRISKRQVSNAMIGAGVSADGRNRWAVASVKNVEGKGKQRRALIEWRGVDRSSGRAHADSWVPFDNLTSDLQQPWKRARGTPVIAAAVPTQQRDGTATRKSPRVAGEVPGDGMSGGERCAGKVRRVGVT